MKTETLQTCPDCGQENFTARGLQSHQGGKTCKARRASQTTELVVLKPGSTETVSVLPQLAVLDLSAKDMAACILADINRYERTSREAAFIALRIGLRLIWIRDNNAYGSLTQFIRAEFKSTTERTLFRYITIAGQFLRDAGMLDKKTHLLTGKSLELAAPIVTEQLELFTDPAAKLEGAMKKLVKWVGTRGLAEIYKDLEARKMHREPPPGGKSEKNDFKGGASTRYNVAAPTEAEMYVARRDLAKEHHIKAVREMRDCDAWSALDEDDAAVLTNELTVWLERLKQHALERQTAVLKAKGGRHA